MTAKGGSPDLALAITPASGSGRLGKLLTMNTIGVMVIMEIIGKTSKSIDKSELAEYAEAYISNVMPISSFKDIVHG